MIPPTPSFSCGCMSCYFNLCCSCLKYYIRKWPLLAFFSEDTITGGLLSWKQTAFQLKDAAFVSPARSASFLHGGPWSLDSTLQNKLQMIPDQQCPPPNLAQRSTSLVRLEKRSKVREKGKEDDKAWGRERKGESGLKRETTWRGTQEHSVLINVFLH